MDGEVADKQRGGDPAGKTGEATLRMIAALSARRRAHTLVMGLLLSGVAAMLIWLSLFVLDNTISLPSGLRAPLSILAAALTLVLLHRLAIRPAIQRQSAERMSVLIEAKYGVKDNIVINSCQLEGRTQAAAAGSLFTGKTLAAAGKILRDAPSLDVSEKRRYALSAAAFAILAILWCGYVARYPDSAANAFARFSAPFRDTPPLAAFAVTVEPSGVVSVTEGADLTVRARLDSVNHHGGRVDGLPPVPNVAWSAGFDSDPIGGGAACEKSEMVPVQPGAAEFTRVFRSLRASFALRVLTEGSFSQLVRVKVIPPPKLKSSFFDLEPPAYTGLKAERRPGPPASLSCLDGSMASLSVEFELPAAEVRLVGPSGAILLNGSGTSWNSDQFQPKPGVHALELVEKQTGHRLTAATGEIKMTPDAPPSVEFETGERNRLVNQFSSVRLDIAASDDYGIKSMSARMRPASGGANVEPTVIKSWTYLGPPGPRGPLKESLSFEVDASRFAPGETYLVDAACEDFCPANKPSISKPVILRIRAVEELAVSGGDVRLASAFEALKKAVAQQRKANAATGNAAANLPDMRDKKVWESRCSVIKELQANSRKLAEEARSLFKGLPDGARRADRIGTLTDGEMRLALEQIDRLKPLDVSKAAEPMGKLAERQGYILEELLSLLGEIFDDSKNKKSAKDVAAESDNAPMEDLKTAAAELKDDLKDFIKAEKRVLEISKSLMDIKMDDLTEGERDILGALAREQGEWAKLFEDKLTDFSKLPYQDFADGSLAKELNEVYQEVKLAEKSLYEKNIELAVPNEQAGLENASELIHNLERWLPDTPDNIKWNMEEPPTMNEAPLAELPAELEDIVGDLLDSEEAMSDDVEDVSSSWMDSLDKGAGWDAMDGPISNMSARGVTGNRLPNQQEIGGRSGEGRTGRSHGQIVEETAEGKGGRQTPTRLSPEPFEGGRGVKDSSKEPAGGATGGGKQAGFSPEGLVGPTPPSTSQKGPRLADKQSVIRQKAEALSAKLRACNTPTGDIESSISEMKSLEKAASAGDPIGVRRAYSKILDRLYDTKTTARSATSARREEAKLPKKLRGEIMEGLRDGVPKGYERMVGEYFKAIAEEEQGGADGSTSR